MFLCLAFIIAFQTTITLPLLDKSSTAYAASLVIVQFNGFGGSKSATALFHNQPIDPANKCKSGTTSSSLAGNVTGGGEFSVNFYSTSDCTGGRTRLFRFTSSGENTTITCSSDLNCWSNAQVPPATVIVQINSFGGSKSATALYRNHLLDGTHPCLPQYGPAQASNVSQGAQISINFYSTSDCTGKRTHFSRFTIKGGNGTKTTITCNSDTDCKQS